jgi:alpha-L-rhamnosidase
VDAQAFFHKWIVDLTDAQRDDGQFPMVAPLKGAAGDGGPAWADAGVICPWTVYEMYGDTTILEQHYEAMRRFVEFSRSRCGPDLLPPKEFHCFGDWLNIDAETPHEVIYTAYFARCADLLGRAAAVLGKTADAEQYRSLFDSVRVAFQRAYMSEEGKVKGDAQTGYVLALAFGLLDEPLASRAKMHLLADIEKRGWHLSTGFVGTKDLMLTLSMIGRNDVAYRLLMNQTFPSWGFTVRHGATSIWERWDGWTPDKGFQNPEMNSFAHYAFGAVYQWMVENIGGIRSEGPGFRRIVLAPEPGTGITWAKTAYTSVNGTIRTEWRVSGGRIRIAVWIPANTSAVVVLPRVGGKVTEGGKPVGAQRQIRPLESGAGEKKLEVGSGRYVFEYALR